MRNHKYDFSISDQLKLRNATKFNEHLKYTIWNHIVNYEIVQIQDFRQYRCTNIVLIYIQLAICKAV